MAVAAKRPMITSVAPSILRYRFHTREIGSFDIHYRTLRDNQQFEDIDQQAENLGVSPASWPMFGVVWQAGEVLAELMTEFDVGDKRTLEIGCGVALASLVLNKRGADIHATDYHPSAQAYLDYNTALNDDPAIPFMRASWKDPQDPAFGTFDLIIASDVMFEPDHPAMLAEFIQRYARATCEVIMADAGRGYRNSFTRSMATLGFAAETLDLRTAKQKEQGEAIKPVKPFTNPETYKGTPLRFWRTVPLQ